MSDLQAAKARVRTFHAELDAVPGADATTVMATHCAPDLLWRGFHPFGEITGPAAVAAAFLTPLKQGLTRLQRREDIFFSGLNEIDGFASSRVMSIGHLMGLFDAPWPGIRLTGKPGEPRMIDLYRRSGDKLAENWIFIDLLHFWKAQGVDVPARTTGRHPTA